MASNLCRIDAVMAIKCSILAAMAAIAPYWPASARALSPFPRLAEDEAYDV